MTLHHRIWELVTATSNPRKQNATDSAEVTPTKTRNNTTAQSIKNLEAEISRLTWTVLDGKATEAQRRRLADLVNAQHELRRA